MYDHCWLYWLVIGRISRGRIRRKTRDEVVGGMIFYVKSILDQCLQLVQNNICEPMQSLNCLEKTILNIIKSGQVPNHIGFIMDGNRRYAKKNRYESTYQGHVQGVKSLKKCMLICKQLGVKQISLFCFSVENFNRSKQEVDGLMSLCMETFQEMSSMSEMLLKNRIKVNIVGRKQLLREDVREALEKIENRTKEFEEIVVNLCFAYDSFHQIETSISQMKQKSYKNFMKGLQIKTHLDILVRTANEYRFSNFMLPQVSYAYICILKETWPEINLLAFCKIILGYNYHYKDIVKNKMRIQQKITEGRIENEETGEGEMILGRKLGNQDQQGMLSVNSKKTS